MTKAMAPRSSANSMSSCESVAISDDDHAHRHDGEHDGAHQELGLEVLGEVTDRDGQDAADVILPGRRHPVDRRSASHPRLVLDQVEQEERQQEPGEEAAHDPEGAPYESGHDGALIDVCRVRLQRRDERVETVSQPLGKIGRCVCIAKLIEIGGQLLKEGDALADEDRQHGHADDDEATGSSAPPRRWPRPIAASRVAAAS